MLLSASFGSMTMLWVRTLMDAGQELEPAALLLATSAWGGAGAGAVVARKLCIRVFAELRAVLLLLL
jgi:hypothetical protein